MRVYFSAAIYLKDKFGSNYESIISILQGWGHTVKHDHITNNSLEQIFQETDDELKNHYKEVSHWMKEADFIVIEATFPSSVNIGHEITVALAKGKPVIVLYQKGLKPTMLVSIENPNLICVEYTPETLENDLEMAVDYIEGQMDVRFNLFLSSKMSQYLDQISKEEKISKSHFLRNLIKDHMKQHS